MSAIVFTSAGGRKYHFDEKCRAFESAQQLSDWDTPDDAYLARWAYPTLHALARTSSTKAAMDGQLPCLVCVPAHLREMPPLDGETFGHKPAQGLRGANVCASCRTWKRNYWLDEWGNDHSSGPHASSVNWPCTSAIVLGLAPRPRDVA